MPGIIDYDSDTATFSLKTEGAVKFGVGASGDGDKLSGPIRQLQQITDADQLRVDLLESLRVSGVPSLEFRGLSLCAFFQRALQAIESTESGSQTLQSEGRTLRPGSQTLRVVISRRDGEGGIDWNRLFAARETQLKEFVELIGRLHPRVSCSVAPRGVSGPDVYGETLPEVLLARATSGGDERDRLVDPKLDLPEQGIVFLGPASLYAILDWMFEARPFTNRLTVLRTTDTKRSQLFRLINGYDLQLLFQEKLAAATSAPGAKAFQKRVLVTGDLIRNSPQPLAGHDPRYQNIFGPVSFHVLKRDPLPARGARLPCSGCMACQQICPVDARPFALVEGVAENFRADRCLECGLCDFVCESGIPISQTIAARRKASGFIPRDVC